MSTTRPMATDPKALLQSTLDAAADNVAVLDARGTIVLTNIAWRQFAMAYSPLAGRPATHRMTSIGSP